MRYLCLAFLIALLVACGTPSAAQPTDAPSIAPEAIGAPPTAAPVVLEAATDAPLPSPEATLAAATPEVLAQLATDEPAPTDAPAAELATSAPTAAPVRRATNTPAAVVVPTKAPVASGGGVAPSGTSCPADHPVKGNIGKEKIYHIPGDNGYAQTKPERCFVDAKEAEAAGFRAVKK